MACISAVSFIQSPMSICCLRQEVHRKRYNPYYDYAITP